MKRATRTTLLFAATAAILAGATLRAVSAYAPAPAPEESRESRIERGAYLVRTMGCHDCHTPWTPGPNGPEPDMSRALTGHPAAMVMPPPPALSGPWMWSAAATNTAFAGPWGVSFTANLTPDVETGLGKWTEDIFIATMKTGRHEGKGRALLPPMPFPMLAALTGEDIRALFAYLQSLPPVRNRVPAPIDPPEDQR
jgi:hypothetical protein